ncbi:hypothetical protein BLNAU_9892 [Blattamonas nauphoetae]|uniref:Uncharacterized protein n=1 Tax=Blattamonas nauphoetae TaxID=2049346 RepID=A0ABQ9XUK6_9EUKA|nr:hypothetical protein BLNAU_9892 [Blattamonas nauphoetae]
MLVNTFPTPVETLPSTNDSSNQTIKPPLKGTRMMTRTINPPLKKFIFANKTGLAAAKIAEICFTPLHLSLLRLICFSAVDFGSDSVTFVGSAIHFAYTLLSQPLSSHSFEGCDAKEQPSLTTMLRTSDASCARCFKNIVMHQRKHLDKESERGGRGKDGIRGGTEHPQHLLITPGELTAKEAIVIGGRKPAKSRQTQPKEGSDDENNRFNKQQKEGRRGRRRAERLRRKGRLNDLKQKTENSDTLEMLTEILMAPTVKQWPSRNSGTCHSSRAEPSKSALTDSSSKRLWTPSWKRGGGRPRRSWTPLPTLRRTYLRAPGLKSLYAKQIEPASDHYLPLLPLVRSVFAIEDDEVEGGRHQAAQTGRIAPRGGIGRGESDKDDDVKEPIPIVLQDIVSNILHVQTAQPDQTVLQRQKRKRERRLRNELHSIFKEEEELSTSEEERRRLRPSLQPSRPVRVSPHPAQRIQTAVYCRQIPFRTQTRQPLHFRFLFLASRPALSQQIQRDRIKSEKPNRRGPHNAKTIVKRSAEETESMWTMLRHFTKMIKKEDIQLLIWEEFTGRDNSQMLDEKVETAPSEYEKPKSKASAKLSKSPAKEKKGKEE